MHTQSSPPNRIPSALLKGMGLVVLLLLAQIPEGGTQAQVTASGLNTAVAHNGTVYEITGGTRPGTGNGPNLFHSFGDFSLVATEVARFQTAPVNPIPDPTVSNILGRVSGGNPSSIFGTIDSLTYYPNANLFLLNPAGIIFGPTATLNVGGSVHFTTADYIRLADQALFNAVSDATADALLSSSPVAAFGFLGTNTGAITVQGSQLSVPNGNGIALTSHSIIIQAGTLADGAVQTARLSAPGGHLSLAALSGPGEIAQTTLIPLTNTLGEFPVDASSMRIAGNSAIDVTGAGRVSIRGGQFILNIEQALLTTASSGVPTVTDNVTLGGNGSFIRNSMFGGTGIDAIIEAQSIKLMDSAQIISRAEGLGPGGGITLKASSIEVNGASIKSIIEPFDFVFEELRGPSLTLNVGNLSVINGGRVAAESTDIFGIGAPIVSGTITITASDTVNVAGTSAGGAFSAIESRTNSGVVGDIVINTSKLLLTQSGRINSEAEAGQAGKILVTATDSIKITDGGKVRMNTSDLGGGLVDLFAPSIRLDQAIIQTRTVGTGDAATVQLRGNDITIAGGQINSQSTEGLGRGGDVTLNATGTISISGQFSGNAIDSPGQAGIFTTTAVQGAPGGNIMATAGQSMTMTNGASISASSTGSGNAGNIWINAGQQFEMRDSSITTEALHARGGNIDVRAVDQIRFVNSSISTSVLGGAGSGGNITIDPNVVVLQNSQIFTKAVQGAGGNITIFTPLFLADSSSRVDASSQFGLNGTVTIQSPTSNLSESLGTLTSEPSQAQSLLTQRCAALANGQASSFVVAGREQLPSDPGNWLTSPIALAGLGESLDAGDAAASAPAIMAMAAQDSGTVSLRRLTPAGFLIANFADSEATGCHS